MLDKILWQSQNLFGQNFLAILWTKKFVETVPSSTFLAINDLKASPISTFKCLNFPCSQHDHWHERLIIWIMQLSIWRWGLLLLRIWPETMHNTGTYIFWQQNLYILSAALWFAGFSSLRLFSASFRISLCSASLFEYWIELN